MKSKYSTEVLKLCGFNDYEIRLIQQNHRQDSTDKPVFSEDKVMQESARFTGLSSNERSIAESTQQEFGNVFEPWKYSKKRR